MSLEAERRFIGTVNPLQGAVEQRLVGHAQVGGHRRLIHRKAVVLRGDHHHVVINIFYRMVAAVVAELHLHGLRAARQSQQLVAEADAEYRNIGLQELLNRCDSVVAGRRVAGTVGQEDTVRIHFQHLFSGGLCRHHRQTAAAIDQHAQDVALGAEIVGHHVERQLAFRFGFRQVARQRPAPLRPAVGFCGGHFLRQIHAVEARERFRFFQRQLRIRAIAGDDAAVLRAFFAQQAGQLTGIDIGNRHDIVALQIRREVFGIAEVAGNQRQIANDQTLRMYLRRFFIGGIGADVADMGIS